MCGRNLRGGRTRANLPLDEITIDDFKAWFSQEFLQQLNTLFMCGNFGDPITAQDCLAMFAHARAASGSLNLAMNTNGSARNAAFWTGLAHLGVTVRFALDGATAESHVRYRRHTRFDAILKNAQTFIDAGGKAVWEMLVFKHSQHEVPEAERMATEMGFSQFVLKSTNRFYDAVQVVQDETGAQVDTLRPSDAYPAPILGNRPSEHALNTCGISCKVSAQKSLYVASSGMVFPCCWLGGPMIDKPGLPDSRFHDPHMSNQLQVYHDLIGMMGQDNLSLHKTPLPVIVNRYFPHFARRWAPDDKRLMKCAQICGKTGIDPFESTFVDKKSLAEAGNPSAG